MACWSVGSYWASAASPPERQNRIPKHLGSLVCSCARTVIFSVHDLRLCPSFGGEFTVGMYEAEAISHKERTGDFHMSKADVRYSLADPRQHGSEHATSVVHDMDPAPLSTTITARSNHGSDDQCHQIIPSVFCASLAWLHDVLAPFLFGVEIVETCQHLRVFR